jgi:uncharacterized membrane protein
VRKYLSAPAKLPEDLIWFKWEAYLTWVTGFLLLCLQYYVNAGSYLIDPQYGALAVASRCVSLGSMAVGWTSMISLPSVCVSPASAFGWSRFC